MIITKCIHIMLIMMRTTIYSTNQASCNEIKNFTLIKLLQACICIHIMTAAIQQM